MFRLIVEAITTDGVSYETYDFDCEDAEKAMVEAKDTWNNCGRRVAVVEWIDTRKEKKNGF